MKTIISILFVLSISAQNLLEFSLNKVNQTKKIIAVNKDSTIISRNCLNSECLAWSALKQSQSKKYPASPRTTHLASSACAELGGINQIVTANNDKQYDFCFFTDQSFIDSWRLVN